MRLEAKSLLFDMRQACDLIIEFTAGKSYSAYAGDAACRSAVERQFITLGEALSRLSKTCPEELALIPAHRTILSFRNILVHGYDKVEDEVVWGIIRTHVPALHDTLVRLLDQP